MRSIYTHSAYHGISLLFVKVTKETIKDTTIYERVKRAKRRLLIGIFLSIPGLLLAIILTVAYFDTLRSEFNFYTSVRSVYAHGEIFNRNFNNPDDLSVRGYFSDYGLDYRQYQDKQKLIAYLGSNRERPIVKVSSVEEYKELEERKRKLHDLQTGVSLFIPTLYTILLFLFMRFICRDFILYLKWYQSESDDIDDFYKLLKK